MEVTKTIMGYSLLVEELIIGEAWLAAVLANVSGWPKILVF
jgi:hypothetical protein